MARFKGVSWDLETGRDGKLYRWEQVQVALLMDIRDELQQLNRTLACANFQRIPWTLKVIAANTKRRKRPTLKMARKRAA